MQRLPGLGCSKFGTRNGDHRLGSITVNSTHGIKPLCHTLYLAMCCVCVDLPFMM